MRTLIFVLSFFIYSLSSAQCNDGNNATLAETKAWLKLIFSENGNKTMGYYSVLDTFAKSGGYLIVMYTRDGGSTKFYISGYSKSQIEEFVDDMEYTMSGEWRNR